MRIASSSWVEVTAHRQAVKPVRPAARWPGQQQSPCRRPCRRRTRSSPRIRATPPETAGGEGALTDREGASADLGVIWGRLLRVRRSASDHGTGKAADDAFDNARSHAAMPGIQMGCTPSSQAVRIRCPGRNAALAKPHIQHVAMARLLPSTSMLSVLRQTTPPYQLGVLCK